MATTATLPLERVLPGHVTDYETLRASSGMNREYFLTVAPLEPGGLELRCTRGRCGAEDKPWLLIRHRRTREGLALALAYAGNWRIAIEPTDGGRTRVRADTVPGTLPTFETVHGLPIPGALIAEFTGDWDGGAQPLTRFIRAKLLRPLGDDWPWVQYNTWYDRMDRIDEARLLQAVGVAAELGCEVFVVDAGWFGTAPDWFAAVGDWRVNGRRLPGGLEPIVKAVRSRGMRFGLWVEVECAGPDTPVAKGHPDWFLRTGEPGRRVLRPRRGVLNLGHPDALAWAEREIDRLVVTYALDYLKMDFNTDPGSGGAKPADAPDALWAHYRGLAELWTHLRATHPKLVVENCASGSLRQDLFTAAHTDTHWVSDAVGGADNLAMNFGATYLFPPEICNHWTCSPEPSGAMDLQTQFTVSMLGQFGLSGAITTWDDETRRHAAERIALYKRLRPWLRKATVYHLTEQVARGRPGSIQAVQYADAGADRSVVFAFQGGAPETVTALALRGLRPEETYRVTMPPGFGPDAVHRGDALARGLTVRFPRRGSSAVIRIQPASGAD
jgi:alpha-galactosidase